MVWYRWSWTWLVQKLFIWSQTMCSRWQHHIRCYVMSYWSTTGLYPGPYSFPVICKWHCPIYWEPKLQHFCRRCYDLLIRERHSTNLQYVLNSLTPWYSANRLSISAQKSAVILIGKHSQVKNSILAVSINGDPLEQVCSTKYLGVTGDNTLSWDSQCDNLCFKLAGKIAVLRRIRSSVKTETLKLLYEKTIQPVMDYTCSVWCHTKKSNIDKLQRVQNYAARIITGNFDYINTLSIDILRSLRWETVQERCDYFTAV